MPITMVTMIAMPRATVRPGAKVESGFFGRFAHEHRDDDPKIEIQRYRRVQDRDDRQVIVVGFDRGGEKVILCDKSCRRRNPARESRNINIRTAATGCLK